MKTEVFVIGGMHCAACSASVERVTKALDGVLESNVNLTTEKMTISYDEAKVSKEDIIREVENAGFDIYLFERTKEQSLREKEKNEKQDPLWPLVLAGVFALGLFILCMGPMMFGLKLNIKEESSYIIEMLLSIGVMIIGRSYFKSGFKALMHKSANMDTLVAISCSVSFIYSFIQLAELLFGKKESAEVYFESCGVVLFFIMLGKTLEARSKKKTKESIEGLKKLSPDTALLVVDGEAVEVPAEKLKVGDTVLIQSGNRVPADAVITEGSAEFDESMFTGESIPAHRKEKDQIIGGSILADGSFVYARIVSVGEDTTLSSIIRFVEDAQGKKAPIAKLADKVAGVFVPCVICIAFVAAFIWAVLGKDFSFVLKIFTTVLVIACPCALGLATPTAIICGTGLGAKNGILIRSGAALEEASKTNIVVFDKTGTLTKGIPMLYGIYSADGDKEEVLRIASSVEMYSDHPLAKAVCTEAGKLGLGTKDKLEEFEYISGRGIVAVNKEGKKIIAGNKALLSEKGVDTDPAGEFYAKASAKGQSIIFIAVDGRLFGALSLADEIKQSSTEAVNRLNEMGVETVLLTGDNSIVANTVANEIGIQKVIAEVLPEDKALMVEKLKEGSRKVMMVGDGINDAPALVAADTGIAIGSGSDIAVESADIVLMKDDPLDVAKAIKLSKLTIRNIKQNLFWAFFYNCIGIPIAAGLLYAVNGMLLTPMIGGLAMSFSSVFVVSNALRLKTLKL